MDNRDHFIKLVQVTAHDDYLLELHYADGVRVTADISPLIRRGKVFKPLEDKGFFRQVRIREPGYALEWPDSDIDLDAPALRMEGQGHSILEYRDPVAEEVARLFRESGLSLREVARRMNVSHPNLVRWNDPHYRGHTVNTLRRLGNALGYRLVIRFEKLEQESVEEAKELLRT